MLVWSLQDLTESVGVRTDRLIALKFPAYLTPHPSKTVWLLHQHRGAYDQWHTRYSDLFGAPEGAHFRTVIHNADTRALSEVRGLYTLSENVSRRLRDGCGLSSIPLYHPPPDAGRIRTGAYGDYMLVPSRVNESKRQDLVIAALERTRNPVRAVFQGAPDSLAYAASLRTRSGQGAL